MDTSLKNNFPQKSNTFNIVLFVLFVIAFVGAVATWSVVGLSVALVAGVVFLLAIAPENGLYLMALLFPFIGLQFYYGNKINLPYIDLVALLTFCAWFGNRAWRWANNGEEFLRSKDLPGVALFLLFLLSSVLSLYNSDNILRGIKFILRPLAFFYLMFVVTPYNLVTSKKVLIRIFEIFFFDGIVISLMGVASLFFMENRDLFRIVPIAIAGVYPLGINQNLIAEALVVIMPFTAILAMWATKPFIRKMYIMGLVFMVVVALGTLSRAAWLTVFVELMIFAFLYLRLDLKKIFPAAVAGFIIFLPLFFFLTQLIASDVSRNATENRYLLTTIAIDAFYNHPIVGNGIGRYVDLVSQNRDYIKIFGEPLDSHGVIQKLIAENGLFGLLTFALFVGYILKQLISGYKRLGKDDRRRQVVLACFIVTIAGLFFQLFNTSYYIARLWLPIGLALTTLRLIEKKEIV